MPTPRNLSLVAVLTLSLCGSRAFTSPSAPAIVQFVFTSDSHFGLTRKTFRGATDVRASVVNEGLVAAINALPAAAIPRDGGIGAGAGVGPIDFVANTGDIANRAETTADGQIQPASASWAEFQRVYLDGVHLVDHDGRRSPVFVVPGNHDVSNAVGFHRPMVGASTTVALSKTTSGVVSGKTTPDVVLHR